jgi:hypothetical protein
VQIPNPIFFEVWPVVSEVKDVERQTELIYFVLVLFILLEERPKIIGGNPKLDLCARRH